jgi:prepilin-type N-terminal cleavage/methylation domain-containing protein
MKINKTKMFSSAFTLIELLVVIAIIAILASIALPVFSSVQEKGKQTKDLSNGKQIALALKQFAIDNDGVFPNKVYAFGSAYTAATDLATTDFSNDAFRWLLPTYLSNEDMFALVGSAWSPNAPDNIVDQTAGGTSLVAGENAYAYVTGLNDTSNPQFPLLGDAGTGAAATDNVFTNIKADKGGFWGGQKAIVIFVDGSGKVVTLDDKANFAPFRPGRTYHLFDNGSSTLADPWLDGAAATNPNFTVFPE